MTDKPKVVSIEHAARQREAERAESQAMYEVVRLQAMQWERRLDDADIARFPPKAEYRYEFSSPREVNDFVSRLFLDGFDNKHVANFVLLNVTKVEADRFIVIAAPTGQQLGVMNYTQKVFESGLRMLDTPSSHNLIVTANGLWSSANDDDLDYLISLMLAEPDFGPGAVEKTDEEIERMKVSESEETEQELDELEGYLSSIDGVFDEFDKDRD